MDPSTAFGRNIEYRHTARKAYVHQDTSRRARAAVMRNSGPLPGKYAAGDLVCYRIERDSNGTPSWSGVSRIIGFDGKTVWVTHRGVPVATSLGKLRPCTSAEVLAYQVLSKGTLQYEHQESEREQQRFVDARQHDSDADDENEEEDEEDSPQPAVARADPLPGERTVRRRVGPTREESRAEPVEERPTMEEPETEDAGVLFDPAEVFGDAADIPVPESQDESLSQEQSLLSQFGDVPKYGTKGYDDFRAFAAIRMETPEAMKWLKKRRAYSNKNKAAQGKVFTYEKCSPELQKGIDGSRKVEWDKWKQFNAAIDLDEKHYRELIAEGHEEVPLKWVDTDKNDALRGSQPDIEVKHKSRLVTRGDLESGDIRSDSPTADIEAQNLVFSFASSRKVMIGSADITNAYFQGEELDRVLILKQPKGGLPGEPRKDVFRPEYLFMGLMMEDASFGSASRLVLLVKGLKRIRFSKHCMRCTTVRDVLSPYFARTWTTFYGRPSQRQNLSLSSCSVCFHAERSNDASSDTAGKKSSRRMISLSPLHAGRRL